MSRPLSKPFHLEKNRVNNIAYGDNQPKIKVLRHLSVLLEIHDKILPTKFLRLILLIQNTKILCWGHPH